MRLHEPGADEKSGIHREQGGIEMDWIALFDSQLPMIVLWVIALLAFVALVYYGRTRF
jgi:hypothetical protein